MKIQGHHLYILAFCDEPLVKIGITQNPISRFEQLGAERFAFDRSYLVKANDKCVIALLEASLKMLLSNHKRKSVLPLSSGNTEIFSEEVLPKILPVIQSFQTSWPNEVSVTYDVSNIVDCIVKRKARWVDQIKARLDALSFKDIDPYCSYRHALCTLFLVLKDLVNSGKAKIEPHSLEESDLFDEFDALDVNSCIEIQTWLIKRAWDDVENLHNELPPVGRQLLAICVVTRACEEEAVTAYFNWQGEWAGICDTYPEMAEWGRRVVDRQRGDQIAGNLALLRELRAKLEAVSDIDNSAGMATEKEHNAESAPQ